MIKENNHTFAICAYKESRYLEKCVQSLVNQTVNSKIIMCTSTPCEYINNIVRKYNLNMYIREGTSDIKDDWNFAYNSADSKYVTVVHQDDEYDSKYLQGFIDKLVKNKKEVTIFLTDYQPLKDGVISKDVNCKIRKLLRIPIKSSVLSNVKFFKKSILSFGNSICCPTVTYNKELLGDSIFTSDMKFNIDWDTFLKIANIKGRFLYNSNPLVYYRVHDEATSKEFIDNNKRYTEDTEMFNKFWPRWVTKIIMHFYVKAYETYS